MALSDAQLRRRDLLRHRLNNASRRVTNVAGMLSAADDEEVHALEHICRDLEQLLDRMRWG